MSEYIRDAVETQDLPVTRRLLRHRQNGRHVLLRVSAAPTRNCPFKETLTQGSGCRWHSSELNVLISFSFTLGQCRPPSDMQARPPRTSVQSVCLRPVLRRRSLHALQDSEDTSALSALPRLSCSFGHRAALGRQ